jgi:hypothetical protein
MKALQTGQIDKRSGLNLFLDLETKYTKLVSGVLNERRKGIDYEI